GWQFYLCIAVAAVSLGLTWTLRKPTLTKTSLLLLLNVVVIFVASAATTLQEAATPGNFEVYLAPKAAALVIALLPRPPVVLAYVIIPVCGIAPLLPFFFILPPELRQNIPTPEPEATAVYAIVAAVVLFYRLRSERYARELFLQKVVEESEEGVWI